jgi:hypothetical protein
VPFVECSKSETMSFTGWRRSMLPHRQVLIDYSQNGGSAQRGAARRYVPCSGAGGSENGQNSAPFARPHNRQKAGA